jgi:spermidine synthase
MHTSTGIPTWRVAALLFGSGCCALVYQIAWVREFRLIFGATTAASAAVLAIFIGGLGLGGVLLGPRADRHARPLGFYAQLEAIIAIFAAVSPLLLALVRTIYIAVGGTATLGDFGGTVLRLLLSTLVLAVPTLAMGGTLPAAARSVTRFADARRRSVAVLYGVNTLGAVVGCVAANFLMLEVFGTRSTLWLAAALNLLIAVVATQMSRSTDDATEEATVEAAEPSPSVAVDAQAPVWFVLTASGVVGFAFFLMELVWFRMLGPLLGGSVFTFGLILAIALVGIGLGGLLYAIAGHNRPATVAGFGFTCLLEAAAIAFAYALGNRLAMLAMMMSPLTLYGFWAQALGWTVVTAIVVLPAALVAGYQFPMLIALLGRGRAQLGRQIGLTYATNTVGAIVGALAGGFGLLPLLSATGAWQFVAVCLVVLGVVAAVLAAQRGARRALAPQLVLLAATIAMIVATGPTAVWRHSEIGVGRSSFQTLTTPNQVRDWTRLQDRTLIWEGDGTEAGVAMIRARESYAFYVNGKSDGSAVGDASTQVMLGLLGAMLHPNPRRSLVIGLGTGSTAGWLGAIPSMERVDVAELEPLILRVARETAAVNHDVLNNPKVNITIGDARELLLLSRDRYDVIVSAPSNPFRAGIASLYTEEYYRAATDRLTDDGVFVQWMQAYELDAPTLRTIYATMRSVFPYVESWQTHPVDLVLVASKRPLQHKASALAARIEQEPFKSALRNAWRVIDLHGVLAHFVAGNRLSETIASTPGVALNRDDRNVVEFGLARSVGRKRAPLIDEVRSMARHLGDHRPAVVEDVPLDWSEVSTALASFYAAAGTGANVTIEGNFAAREHQKALVAHFQGNQQAARQLWGEIGRGPRDPNELAMFAQIESNVASEAALPHIERLRAYFPAEADYYLANLRGRLNAEDEAAAILEKALVHFRTDPWSSTQTVGLAIRLAGTLGERKPEIAQRMFRALAQPFAAGIEEDLRITTAAGLSRFAGFAQFCPGPVGALEPHTPWNAGYLTLRQECYRATGDARLEVAARELGEFLQREAESFAAGVPAPASQPTRSGGPQ